MGPFPISVITFILLTIRGGSPQVYLRPQESDFLRTAVDAQLVKIGMLDSSLRPPILFYCCTDRLLFLGLIVRRSQESAFLEQAVHFTVEDINALKLGILFRVNFIRVEGDADWMGLTDLSKERTLQFCNACLDFTSG